MAARDEWRIDPKTGEPVRLTRLQARLWDGKLTGPAALAAGRWIGAKQHGREQAEQAAAVAEADDADRADDRAELQRQRLARMAAENQRDYERWLFDQLDAKPDPPRAPFPF